MPPARKIPRGERCNTWANNQCAPETRNTPTNEIQLAIACTCPRFSAAGRGCNKADTGTMKNPPAKPSNASRTMDVDKCAQGQTSSDENSARPKAPSGTRPYSILPPDK